MPKLIINDREIEVEPGLNLLQACEQAGAEIPRFCYHERLSIAGNCRMCLVELEGSAKPVASCAMAVNDMRPGRDGKLPTVRTDSALVKRAREGVMEFLLINHPLDCPICDQGGECDLQDQAMGYGIDGSRFRENKRAVTEKNLGPLIKTYMTRCIQCTRCVRFMTEVAGVSELGATGRGEDMEIMTYLERGMFSELSGNVIDLCPVGALTSKPYAFKARPWELRKTESIDVMDGLGSNIRVDSRGREILRVLPRIHDGINEEWISDKTLFHWDGLRKRRLDRPYIRREGRLTEATWRECFTAIAARIEQSGGDGVGAIAGDLAAVEEMFALQALMRAVGSPHLDCRQDGAKLDPSAGRPSYLFNATIAGIEAADAILLVGVDPRLEGAVLNARLRKAWRLSGTAIAAIGPQRDLTYTVTWLGEGPAALGDLGAFASVWAAAKRPVVILGMTALARPDGEAIAHRAGALLGGEGRDPDWSGFNVLHNAAARVGGLDIGFVPGVGGHDIAGMMQAAQAGKLRLLYLLGADEVDLSATGHALVVYQGSHGDRGARLADIVLPGATYVEKSGTYVNTEGRVQMAERAIFPPGDAREDWTIIRALSETLGRTLPFDTLPQLRAAIYAEHPHLAELDRLPDPAPVTMPPAGGAIDPAPFTAAVEDFYLTNPIARASGIMAEMSAITREPEIHAPAETTGTYA